MARFNVRHRYSNGTLLGVVEAANIELAALAGANLPATRKALDQAGSPQEWNMYLLSSPEFMHR